MGGLWHLTTRFFGAVRPGAPAEVDDAWACHQLLPGEQAIWDRMNNPDRRHAIDVARAVVERMEADGLVEPGEPVDRPIVAAALLHDSGKVISGFRTPARVVATVLWAVADDGMADEWLGSDTDADTHTDVVPPTGLRSRMAAYRRHPELGGAMLRRAGADPLTAAWAEQHHQPEQKWTVPAAVGRVLKACDDD